MELQIQVLIGFLSTLCLSVLACVENGGNDVVSCDESDLPDPWILENKLEAIDPEDGVINSDTRTFGLSHSADDVKFMLYYSPKHPTRSVPIYLNEDLVLTRARFKIGPPVIFITHGFLSNASIENTTVPIIKNALLSMSIVNIIAVDWSRLSTSESPVAFLSYAEVTQNVGIVGRHVADMIEFLIKLNIISGPGMVHLIGHSLGAHVMGVAGHEIKNRSGLLIDHITGLDPAGWVLTGPLYQFIKAEDKLGPSDAAFVDALHTDIGMFGSSEVLGTADFYANGGKGYAQPGCLNFTNMNPGAFIRGVSGICSHSRAYRLYARTITRTEPELYGCRCRIRVPSDFLPTSCTIQEMTICPDKVLYGYYGPRTAKGTYYVETKEVRDVSTTLSALPIRPPPW